MKHLILLTLCILPLFTSIAYAEETVIISAEGLADPESPAYLKDKSILLDALRTDARKQVIEKAVGTIIQSSTLMENYEIIHDRVLTKSQGLIKKIIKESEPWLGDDGFMHILLKAEVVTGEIRSTLETMSKQERISLLQQHENPRISVSVWVQDTDRASVILPQRSDIAENLLKQHIKSFGYRVWSADALEKKIGNVDFSITGQVKFKPITVKLNASGLSITKYALTSWTVKCMNLATNEEIYFNNKVPKKQSWADEDTALEDIGKLIGSEFSSDFFEQHLMTRSKVFQLQVKGLPSYDIASLLKKELLGLRPVLNIDLRNFERMGTSLYEIEFAGTQGNFQDLINNAVIDPLNRKFGNPVFFLDTSGGGIVVISYQGKQNAEQLAIQFNTIPPASLANTSPARLQNLQLSKAASMKVVTLKSTGIEKAQETVAGNTSIKTPLKKITDF